MNVKIEQLRHWFEYEKDSHSKTISSLLNVPAQKRNLKEFQKAVDLFAHIIGARWLWLYRMGFSKNLPDNLFPTDVNVEEINSMAEKLYAVFDEYFIKLDEKELNRIFEYKSIEGLWYTNEVEEILTQLFGHSWYHRGQIAQLVRMIGESPAETDYVYWTRKKIPAKD